MVDQVGTTYSVKEENEIMAQEKHNSRRRNGSIKDHPLERMVSANQQDNDR
ncbi:small acid-soluble spore protein K [Terrilactibacillus laevilacticus]|uniref:Small acid-soluble spore protein K n=1 Tax=Terrilactibacillus laevilacticus TaxID=1380157 RepID=A0ABW5PP14_9BACI|nr:small acid-soluble spore protein K [Terrilactibacillus laevilacticus]